MIDEAQRRQLWQSLTETLGEPQADCLMTMLPAQPLPDLATREDIAGLRGETQTEFAAVRREMTAEFASVRREMHTEFDSVRTEMRTGFGAVRTEMSAMHTELMIEIQSLEHRTTAALAGQIGQLRSDVVSWILALGAVMITMFAAVITLGLTGAFA